MDGEIPVDGHIDPSSIRCSEKLNEKQQFSDTKL
jgi:hypothetical protein